MSVGIPLIVYPEKPDTYKFVQFYRLDSKPVLRLSSSPGSSGFHAFILRDFARELGMKSIRSPHTGIIYLPEDFPYEPCGFGSCYAENGKLRVDAGSKSEDYGIRVDRGHFTDMCNRIPELNIEFV